MTDVGAGPVGDGPAVEGPAVEGPGDGATMSILVRPIAAGPDRSVAEQGVRVGFGIVAIATEVVLRVIATSSGRGVAVEPPGRTVVDAALGAGWGAARMTGRVVGLTTRAAGPVVAILVDPPLIPQAIRPATALDAVAHRWREDREQLTLEAVRLSRTAVPAVIESVATTLDLDAALSTIVDRLDLDRLVQHVLSRLDLDEIAGQAISELDLTPIINEAVRRVDLQPVVTEVIDQLDLAAVITQVLKEVDLTTIVTGQVDLATVVNSALDDLDLTALVMQRVDLVAIADYVVDAIDLPGIVRDSTGSIATESVRTVRLQAVDADRVVARLVDRLTLRGGRARKLDAPGEAEAVTKSEEPEAETQGPNP